jgi:hypothetical protein
MISTSYKGYFYTVMPPPLPQITAPPQKPQITAPPVNISFDNMFGSMLDNMIMPRAYGYKSQSYAPEYVDEDVMDAIPPPQQKINILKNKLNHK